MSEPKSSEPKGSGPKSEMDALFDLLVPPDEVVIEDIWGNTYKAPGRVSASRQIAVMRIVREIMAHRAADDALAALSGAADAGGAPRMIAHLLTVVADEVLVERFAAAFVAAHPQITEAARAAATARGETSLAPTDLFAIEEMAAALVPLFVRLGRRALDGFRGVAAVLPAEA